MNLKERKNKIQECVVEVIKSMLPKENVDVRCDYDIEQDNIHVLIYQSFPHAEIKEANDRIVVYSCSLSLENKAIAVIAFSRKFGYDGFGISAVVNNPITVDEAFMNGIKNGILIGMENVDKPAAPINEEVQDAQVAE